MAMKPTTTATVTTTRELKLRPQVRAKLLSKLQTYAQLKAEMKALEDALGELKGEIGEIRASTGEQSIELEGFKVSEVRGVHTSIDEKKLLTWITTAQLEQAKVTKPRKAYEKISLPEEKD
jgi:hypothetical protein